MTGLSCVVLPAIESSEEQAAVRTGEYAISALHSRFVETLRSIWAVINIAQQKSDAKVIGVVSLHPDEGKTTVATISRHISPASNNARPPRPTRLPSSFAHRKLAPDAKVGLKEALAEPKHLSKFVMRKEKLNLDVLP